jgi:hypothetical protein
MSASERRRYVLTESNGQWLGSLVATSPVGHVVTIAPPSRSLDQNAIFHAIVDDFARALPEYEGVPMDAESWKSVLIVSHAIATSGGGLRLVRDLEGQGLVQVRESSARMLKARATSLIDYCIAEAAKRGIPIRDGANT